MRIVFMGTPEFAVPALEALVAAGHEVIAVYTQPPRPGGRRGRELVPSPVQVRAEALGIAVRTPVTLRDAGEQAAFAGLGADVAVVAAYGLILPPPVLVAPRLGCLNLHASILPRWRGAAPIQRAILAGDAETGVCVMQMAAGLDTGAVRLERRTAVAGKTAGELTGELAAIGAAAIVAVLADVAAFPAVAQVEDGVTYAAKMDKTETRLDFSRDAAAVERQVRAFSPPGAWFAVAGERVRVLECDLLPLPSGAFEVGHAPGMASTARGAVHLERVAEPKARSGEGQCDQLSASHCPSPQPSPRRGEGVVLDDCLTIACGSGAIRPTLVQRAGRGVMTVAELLRGFPISAGTQL